ncbi:hypothetical protein COCNU_06G017850 [Cocos nucifera]|uniref:Uncharacterized protein n=1 Tax=Cocos nucifera TaxID=13894 RepID=A0A8K0IEB4_COCNU|nr:hypothetical protein COCNU_06G017850 [Cocos nucifera]
MGSMLNTSNDSTGASGGVVDLNFFAFLEEGSPQEEPNLFLKANLIDSSEGLVTVILNRRVRVHAQQIGNCMKSSRIRSCQTMHQLGGLFREEETMAFVIPKKPLHSSSSAYDDDDGDDERPRPQSSVTSCIYLKPDAGGAAVRRSLDKEVVLRRIRQRKRVNQIRTAIQSLLGASPDTGEKDGELPSSWWLDDVFSAP